MSKAVLVMDMPSCCDECFALDDNGDYPMCIITQEQRGYTFKTREQKMDRCPLQPMPEKKIFDSVKIAISARNCGKTEMMLSNAHINGYNACIDELLKGEEG